MNLFIVLCVVIGLAAASGYHQEYRRPYVQHNGYYNRLESPFYVERRHRGRGGRHHDRSSGSYESSRGRSYESYEDHGYQVPSYGNNVYDQPAATNYGTPTNYAPASGQYGSVNTFGRK